MPRKSEIAADARALYGPPSVRPAAGDMGDGALWVDPGDSQALWQVQSGNWRQIALPPADDDSSIPAGVPVLRGPYIVTFSDIPHDGDTLALWTPQVGDVLLRLFADAETLVGWAPGLINVGQGLPAGLQLLTGQYTHPRPPDFSAVFDNIADALSYNNADWAGNGYGQTAYVFHRADPVQAYYVGGAGDGTIGHCELYALVARAVAP